MKQVFRSPQGIKIAEVGVPSPGKNEILVKTITSVISTGTETMGMRHGDKSIQDRIAEKKELMTKVINYAQENGIKTTYELIKKKLNPAEQNAVFRPIGYSTSGVVVSKGQLVNNFNVGDRVACAGSGIAAHAEYVTIPVNLAVKLPDEVDHVSAGFTTIGAIAMQGIRRANVTFGESIVIVGLGLLGLLAVQIAKAWGLVVIGVDLNESRLEQARKYGADLTINASEKEYVNKVNEFTDGNGADAAVIYASTTSSDPANKAMELCRRKGRVVIVGAVGMDLLRKDMYFKELDFVMSTSYGAGRYDDQYEMKGIDYPIGYVRWTENRNMQEFVRLIEAGQMKVDELVSNTFRIEDALNAYKVLVENPQENIASVFEYSDSGVDKVRSIGDSPKKTLQNDKIKVGIIGAGGFIQRNHLANIKLMPEEYELVAISNRTTGSNKAALEKYKCSYTTSDNQKLLDDKDIDLVVIGTRHNLHAEQVINALKAGKHVLVEKPLAMNWVELDEIKEALVANPDNKLLVGFNRRYSPLIQKAKGIIEKADAPFHLSYIVNAGMIAPTSWVQDLEEGGGRIIGEVCHFIDLICYLANSEVREVNVVHVPISKKTPCEDNLIVSLAFEDGSIAVLSYYSFGSSELPKERIEIAVNGSSLFIDDFKRLQTYSCDEQGIELKELDKGHYSLIKELAKSLKGNDSLIEPTAIDIKSTELTLQVLDLIHNTTRS